MSSDNVAVLVKGTNGLEWWLFECFGGNRDSWRKGSRHFTDKEKAIAAYRKLKSRCEYGGYRIKEEDLSE